MNRSRFYIVPGFSIAASLLLLLAASCFPGPEEVNPSTGNGNFTNISVLGGTWMSGYRDGALFNEGQMVSVGALFTEQVKLALPEAQYMQGTILDNDGIGLSTKSPAWQTKGILGDKTDCEGVTDLSVLRDTLGSMDAALLTANIPTPGITDYSIPYASTTDLLSVSFGQSIGSGNTNPFYHRIASIPGSSTAFGDFVGSAPSFFLWNPGFEDIYNHAIYGMAKNPIPPVSVFRDRLDSMLAVITASGAQGVLGDIPDFRTLPFFTTVPPLSVELTTEGSRDTLNDVFAAVDTIQWELGPNGFYIIDSTITTEPFPVRQMLAEEYVLLNVPLDSVKCQRLGISIAAGPLPDRYYLDIYEIIELDNAINEYNAVIYDMVEKYDLGFAPVHDFMDAIQAGMMFDGAEYSSDFVTGNFYSLDGQNPTEKGTALITNLYIDAANSAYSCYIPTRTLNDLNGVLLP